MAALLVSCGRPSPPSILLVVLDTTRVDAVSAYGRVRGTTPTVDRLAAEGLRYTAAYAQANWTLPSHATLFTGLLPSQHGMEDYRSALSPTQPTLAELLQKGGYETVGFSENPWITDANRMTRGFERFRSVDLLGRDREGKRLGEAVGRWIRERQGDRPYFLFLNLMDAHAPYEVREGNAFLPLGANADIARAVPRDPEHYLCRSGAHVRELAILRGLYLGDVQAADRKLAGILGRLADAHLDGRLVIVITADHGEHFGEHGLVLHDVGIHEELVHVPLVVHGLGDAPAVIPQTVMLADVLPTVLAWARIPAPPGLAGRPLPRVAASGAPDRAVIAEYRDPVGTTPAALPPKLAPLLTHRLRAACAPADHVFGDMRALIRGRWKLVTYANYPSELYDLEGDPREEHDVAAANAAVVASLTKELEQTIEAGGHATTGLAAWDDAPAVRDRLRALGYLGGD